MTSLTLYRGVWPQNVSKTAKYSVRHLDGRWKVTVLYDIGDGLRYLAVEGGDTDVPDRVNAVKAAVGEAPGGVFYVNEYRHIVVPANTSEGVQYFFAGRLAKDFRFEFEGQPLDTRPYGSDGTQLQPGDEWVGPLPGIPYILKAGANDLEYRTPALTDDDPPSVRPNTTAHVRLSKVLRDPAAVQRALKPIADLRGHTGGRFYVNEHGAIFTPMDGGDGDGLRYTYCGQIDLADWFPEPKV